MLETPVRNHPTVMLQGLVITVLVLAILLFSFIAEGMDYRNIVLLVAVLAVAAALIVVFWARTYVHTTETEIVSEFNFIMHKRKTVPFSKIASVNVVRNIFDRLFGTATIQVNINSAINAAKPEITLCLKNDLANEARGYLSSRIYGLNYVSESEQVYESAVNLSNRDSILHGIFGTSSWFVLMSAFFLAVSVASMFFQAHGDVKAIVSTSLLFALSFVIPMVALILRYYNFRVYRLGDTIYLQHGAIQLYKTSFKVNKINSVRIKRTFFARLMNKACLEVDVVGINATQDTVPILCILTSMDNIEKLMREVVPDFIYEKEGEAQPKSAAYPWLMRATWVALATLAVYAYPMWYMFFGDLAIFEGDEFFIMPFRLLLVGSFAVLVLAYYAAAHVGFNKNRMDIGEDMFMFETGIVDRVRTVMQYDRAQKVDVYAWPAARSRGLARCRVHMLSAAGRSVAVSGYYPAEKLETIGEEIMGRIADGRYDYRRFL
ncbi:MAG: PH domain-containing protein [Candidatus Methanomethylophilaceae archaeon]